MNVKAQERFPVSKFSLSADPGSVFRSNSVVQAPILLPFISHSPLQLIITQVLEAYRRARLSNAVIADIMEDNLC